MVRGRHSRVKPARLFRIRLIYACFMLCVTGFTVFLGSEHHIWAGIAVLAAAGVITVVTDRYLKRHCDP